MSKKIVWCLPFILFMAVLLSACGDDTDRGSSSSATEPTIDLSAPRVYKTEVAAVIRYFDPLQCPSVGKVTLTIQPDNRAKLEVVSPDVMSKYVKEVGGETECDETGDMHMDIFYGIYDPASKSVIFKTCDTDMHSNDDKIYITPGSAGGQVYCGFTVDDNYQLWVSVGFTSAPLSK
jgi:hypothetical protein